MIGIARSWIRSNHLISKSVFIECLFHLFNDPIRHTASSSSTVCFKLELEISWYPTNEQEPLPVGLKMFVKAFVALVVSHGWLPHVECPYLSDDNTETA